MRARNLLEACLCIAVSGRPIFRQHRKPGFVPPPSSLVCVDLRNSRASMVRTPRSWCILILVIHLQMPQPRQANYKRHTQQSCRCSFRWQPMWTRLDSCQPGLLQRRQDTRESLRFVSRQLRTTAAAWLCYTMRCQPRAQCVQAPARAPCGTSCTAYPTRATVKWCAY